ncbi:MAG TPA: acyl-CoA synthetase [Acidimicrobiia bacterium]|nr:acyl-CoA synthetase [Acidimicrobiia bacterium]
MFNLADCFEKVADAVPDRTALVCGDRRLTFRELDERATRLAHHLAELGVGTNDHVGMYAYNCTEWIETFIACFKLRAAAINVNFRYTPEELKYLFDDADLKAIVHGPEFDPPFDGPLLEVGDDYEKAVAAASPERDFGPRSADDHYVIYTGGTTGYPKGVIWRHEDAFFAVFGGGNYAGEPVGSEEELAEKAATSDQGCYLITPPLMHGAGQWVAFGAGLLQGMKVVLLDGARFDPERALDLVDAEQVFSMSIVGDAMGRPLAEALAANPGRWNLSSLVVIGSGGAPLSPTAKEMLGELAPNCFVIDSFGASETGYQGRATEGRRFQVGENAAVFTEDLRRVEPGSGEVGMLAQGGRIPLEYYKDPDKTARTFVEVEGKRWALPGDMATVEADGTINLLGRGSQSINSGGEKIYPEEVEDALKSHPAVLDALVVGVPDERWGERVAAVVAVKDGAAPSLDELQEHCRSSIAGYKVPRQLEIVDSVPRQPSGKADYPTAKKLLTGNS